MSTGPFNSNTGTADSGREEKGHMHVVYYTHMCLSRNAILLCWSPLFLKKYRPRPHNYAAPGPVSLTFLKTAMIPIGYTQVHHH